MRRYRVWHLRGPDLLRALPLLQNLPQSRKRGQFEIWLLEYRLDLEALQGQLPIHVKASKRPTHRLVPVKDDRRQSHLL